MSSCQVDFDGLDCNLRTSDAVFYKAKIVKKSRKIHVCTECKGEIQLGSSYELVEDKIYDSFVTFKTCQACLCARDHFFDSVYPHGNLWETIFDSCSADSIPEECLSLMSDKFRYKVFEMIEEEWEEEEWENE